MSSGQTLQGRESTRTVRCTAGYNLTDYWRTAGTLQKSRMMMRWGGGQAESMGCLVWTDTWLKQNDKGQIVASVVLTLLGFVQYQS
jgi:hypothetical protein